MDKTSETIGSDILYQIPTNQIKMKFWFNVKVICRSKIIILYNKVVRCNFPQLLLSIPVGLQVH